MPRHVDVADDLRRRIQAGELVPGARLPARARMAADYDVSEGVIRQAITQLTAEGWLYVQFGAAPIVRGRPQRRRLTRSWHLAADGTGSPWRAEMQAQGRLGDWTCDSARGEADERTAERLSIPPGAAVMRTDYVYRDDGTPAMLATSWEPLAITDGTPIVLPERGPHAGLGVVDRMAAIGVEITHAVEVVTARAAERPEAELLGLAPGAIVMSVERTYLAASQPVEHATITVPVDRYELAYVVPAGRPPA